MNRIIYGIVVFLLVISVVAIIYYSKNINENMNLNNTVDDKQSTKNSVLNIYDYNISLSNINEDTININDYKDNIIILNFWATWCGYCIDEFSEFNSYINEKPSNVKVFMINATDGRYETKEKVTKFILENEYDDMEVLFDVNQIIIDKFNILSFPTTLIFDKEGNLYKKILGPVNEITLNKYVNEIEENL